MILYPAIDISEGRAVRLRQGDFDDVTIYQDDPLEAARSWVQAGARYLHVVDLDGARRECAQSAIFGKRPRLRPSTAPCSIARSSRSSPLGTS